MKRIFVYLLIVFVLAACGEVGQSKSNNSYEEEIDSSLPIDGSYEPLEITEILVEQEMNKRNLNDNDWEIKELSVYFDRIESFGRGDKPTGDKRVVWVTGHVDGLNDIGNIDLELYKMDGDNFWYIASHMGVLRDIIVADAPKVDPANVEYSDSTELPFKNQDDPDESEFNESEMEENRETTEPDQELEQRFLNFMYEYLTETGVMGYIDGREIHIKDIDVFVNPPAISERREFNYQLEVTLTNEFSALSENEQYELLRNVSLNFVEYYGADYFSVDSMELSDGLDIFVITPSTLDRNGEPFVYQLDDYYGF